MSFKLHPINIKPSISADNATFLATLDGNRCKTEASLHKELAAILRFPDYYGKNFDAMFDCLTDLEWLGIDKLYMLITHPNLICSEDIGEEQRKLFLDVIKDVLQAFIHHPVELHIIADNSFLNLINPDLDI